MRLRGWMILLLGLLHLRRRRRGDGERPRIVAAGAKSPRAETAVIVLLMLAALSAVAFVVFYAVEPDTQILGGALAGALALLAAALIVAAKHLVVDEELPEEYPEPHPEDQEALGQIVAESGSRITRKRLLGAAAAGAGGALGVALVAPALSLGPVADPSQLRETPWRRGRRLVDPDGRPMPAADVATETFYTAYPEGAAEDELGAPLVLVRLAPEALELPPERAGWDVDGILAFSKICTHAACAVSLYRTPTFEPVEPRPALVCPCHYSTFEPATGGSVIFGPAPRPLPQLPLMVNAAGELVAAGGFSAAVGPSWSGVRDRPQ